MYINCQQIYKIVGSVLKGSDVQAFNGWLGHGHMFTVFAGYIKLLTTIAGPFDKKNSFISDSRYLRSGLLFFPC